MVFAAPQEQQFSELMVQRAQIEEQLRRQLEEQRVHSQSELLQLHQELDRLQREFNQNLLQAENKKQQVCEGVSSFFIHCFLYVRVG